MKKLNGRSRLIVRPGDKYLPLGVGDLAVEAMRDSVLGYTGAEYFGYPVIRLQYLEGVYGRVGGRKGEQWRTLHYGLINHAELERQPTASWAVLAAMFELGTGGKTFDMAEVLERAEFYCGGRGHRMRRQILHAWNILKTHHMHPSKNGKGYSYMVIETDGRMLVRPRLAWETREHCLGRRAAEKLTRQALAVGLLKPSVGGMVTERIPLAREELV